MADINNIQYTITGIDEVNMVIHVDFNGEGFANIGYRGRIPTTQDELDAFVAPFAPHKELVDPSSISGAAPVADGLKLLRGAIGKKNKAARFSVVEDMKRAEDEKDKAEQAFQEQQAKGGNTDFVLSGVDNPAVGRTMKALNIAADKEYLRQLINEVINERQAQKKIQAALQSSATT